MVVESTRWGGDQVPAGVEGPGEGIYPLYSERKGPLMVPGSVLGGKGDATVHLARFYGTRETIDPLHHHSHQANVGAAPNPPARPSVCSPPPRERRHQAHVAAALHRFHVHVVVENTDRVRRSKRELVGSNTSSPDPWGNPVRRLLRPLTGHDRGDALLPLQLPTPSLTHSHPF